MDFDKGWRSDGAASLGNIYWHSGGSDNLRMATGTITVGAGAPATGPYITLDSSACSTTNPILHVDLNNMDMEVDSAFNTSSGVIQMLDCPYTTVVQYAPQFSLNLDSVWVHAAGQGTSGFNFPTLAMSPANDLALNLHVSNSQLQGGIGSNTSVPFVGLPTLAQMNMTKPNGFYAELDYAPSFWSAGLQNTSSEGPSSSVHQLIGDTQVGQLWQYGLQASDFLFSDPAFAALQGGTTVYAGQVLAPPASWNPGNTTNLRLPRDVVYQTGTTGTLFWV